MKNGESVAVIWDTISFLSGSCLLMGFDDVPCVTTYGHVVAEFSRRGILEAPVVGRGHERLLSRLVAPASSDS